MVKKIKRWLPPNDVVAAVVTALMQDYLVNRFSFSGFPAVSHRYLNGKVDGDHEITLCVGGKTVGPYVVSRNDAIAAVKDFYDDKKPDLRFLEAIQKWIIALEAAWADRRVVA